MPRSIQMLTDPMTAADRAAVKQDREAWSALESRVAELEAGIREYLGEYDTPAKDYAYRAACRDKMRKLIKI